jgi:hypothetical protein
MDLVKQATKAASALGLAPAMPAGPRIVGLEAYRRQTEGLGDGDPQGRN